MNKQSINKAIITVALCGLGFISASAFAGPDSFQIEISRKVMEAKQKLQHGLHPLC